jgi:two-component system cell cycle sensor histidine kinase/response regulator CckA
MDLTVPGGMGGVEATSIICGLDEDARVIATSGYAEDDSMSRYQDYGFVARLRKPCGAKDLRNAIMEAMEFQRHD